MKKTFNESKIIIKKTFIILLSLILVVPALLITLEKNPFESAYELSAQQKDFLDTLIQSHELLKEDAIIESYTDEYSVLLIKKRDGTTYKQLFDIVNEKVISPDFKGSLNIKKNGINVVYADSSANEYSYDKLGNLISITRPNMTYSLNRNLNGDILSKKIDNDIILQKTYIDGHVESIRYGNQDYTLYSYENEKCVQVVSNGIIVAEYVYDNDNMIQYNDLSSDETYYYTYDENNKVISAMTKSGFEVNYDYDNDNITSKTYLYNGKEVSLTTTEEGLNSNEYTVELEKDFSERIKNHVLDTGAYNLQTIYNYTIPSPTPSNLTQENFEELYNARTKDNRISSIITPFYTFEYDYNILDKISFYRQNENIYTYQYDDLGQLTNYSLNDENFNLSYDQSGNIKNKNNNSYTYALNTDTLIKVGDSSITYDEIGNPIYYLNHTLDWQDNNLISFDDVDYTYNKSGIRTSQTINGITTKYYSEGNKVIYQSDGENIFTFYYESNNIIGFNYNDKDYYYLKNAHSDIVGITNDSGKLLVEYAYDPFGKLLDISGELANSIGVLNPYRFASYRYDNYTELYYLNSRYYDANIGRFISPDNIENLQYSILGKDLTKNLYTYCNNDPVNMMDPNGTMAVLFLNIIKTLYSDWKLLPDSAIGPVVLMSNGGGIFTAFHETAQLVAAKQLSYKGYATQLEYRVNGVGEADIYAQRGFSNYLYEVKHYASYNTQNKALLQLQKYKNATGFESGPMFSTKTINYLPLIKMTVSTPVPGFVSYEFYKEIKIKILWVYYYAKSFVTQEKLNKCINIGYWTGLALAGTIIIATLAEDIITAGAGIVDDVPSMVVSSGIFNSCVTFGMLLI